MSWLLDLIAIDRKRKLIDLTVGDAARLSPSKRQLIDLTADDAASLSPSKVAEKAATDAKVSLGSHGAVLKKLLLGMAADLENETDKSAFWQAIAKGSLFENVYTRIYSPVAGFYGIVGGKPYHKPRGWMRFGLRRIDFDSEHNSWCQCYHGTRGANVAQILLRGLMRPGHHMHPGVLDGQVGSKTSSSIYLSPSIEYAAFPCYSQLLQLGENHWAQCVLQCRVRPGSFVEQPGTLSPNKHWPDDVPIDSNYPDMASLEWLVEDTRDVVVYGLMLREFGEAADASIYGDLPRQVKQGIRGPEYVWTDLRVRRAREDYNGELFCNSCAGSGLEVELLCKKCKGRGHTRKCFKCDGSGLRGSCICEICDGLGYC